MEDGEIRMSGVDNRVVQMKFDNNQFERETQSTMGLLDKLKTKLGFKGSKEGIEGVQRSFAKFSLGGIGAGVDAIKAKFSSLSVVGAAAIANITTRAVDSGLKIAKAFSTDGIMGGLEEYETNLNSIQTILANTSTKGTSLDDVNKALQELNTYSDKTIYNFSEMAANIGTFTAAGVNLDTATDAIKGIANLAAVSGSSSEQASTAMYQLSQAMSTGVLTLEDWNSVTNAGMGGEVFQKALMDTARVSGVAVDQIVADQGSFRNSLQKKWLTSDILSDTLAKFTGDLTKAQLDSMGYTEEQVKGILKMGVTATNAATKVKTMTQLMDTLKESVGSGWTQSWQIVLGDFEEAKDLFTGINDVLGGVVGASAKARNDMLQEWKDLGGRQALIDSFYAAFKILTNVTGAFSKAFRSVFPAKTAKDWYEITDTIRDFLERVAKGTNNLKTFRTIVKGVFSAFSVGFEFIKAFGGFLKRIFDTISAGSNGAVTQFLVKMAKWVIGLDKAVKKGDTFVKFFDRLFDNITKFVAYLQVGIDKVKDFVGQVDFAKIGDQVKEIVQKVKDGTISLDDAKEIAQKTWGAIIRVFQGAMDQLGAISDGFQSVWDRVVAGFEWVKEKVQPVTDFIGELLGQIKDAFKNAFAGFSAEQLGAGGGILALGGIFTGIMALVKKFIQEVKDFGLQDITNEIGETIGALGNHLNALTANVKAKSLLTLAAAIALLALSVIGLAGIDPEDLTKSLTAIAVGFGQLLIAMGILTKMAGAGGFAKIPIIAAGMIMLAGAVLILALAVRKLSGLSWEDLNKGLTAVSLLLAGLTAAIKVISGSSGGLLRSSVGMIAMATALQILAGVVKDFAGMKWSELAKGMAGVASGLIAMTGAMKLMPKGMLANGVALIAIATALKILYTAVASFSSMDWPTMGRGLAGVAGALVAIAAAMQLMPQNMMMQSLALLAVGAALGLIGQAVEDMGGMSWDEIGKGLATLGGAMIILAGGLKLMSGSLNGAAALVVVASGLKMLVPILQTLGTLPWQVIALGLGALAATFTVLGLAGLALRPIVPTLLALGAAMVIVGAGMTLVGGGAIALAKAFEILVGTGEEGVKTVMAILDGLILRLPEIVTAVGQAVIAFAKVIGDGAPVIVGAFTSIFSEMLGAVQELSPQIMETIGTLLSDFLGLLREKFPELIQTGADLLMSLLDGISKNIGDVAKKATDIVIEFLAALITQLPRLIQQGIDFIIALVKGIGEGIANNASLIASTALDFVGNLVQGIINAIGTLFDRIWQAIKDWLGTLWDNILDFFDIFSPSKKMYWVGEMLMHGMRNGIRENGQMVADAGTTMSKNVYDAMDGALKEAPNLLDGLMEMDPTIKPVLDLSGVQAEATRLNGLIATDALTATGAFERAIDISATTEQNNEIKSAETQEPPVALSFEQTIISPKTPNATEIYRNTASQIAKAREVIGR